jgi:hypothetical protein
MAPTPSLVGRGGTPFSPGIAVFGAGDITLEEPFDADPLASSLPNRAFVFGAETTRRKNRAAAELRNVPVLDPAPLSGDFLVDAGGSQGLVLFVLPESTG